MLSTLFLGGCSSLRNKSPKVRPIVLKFTANSELNLIRGEPRPVHACLYLTKNKDWVPSELLSDQSESVNCMDPKLDSSIITVKHIVLVPGTVKTLLIDVEARGKSWLVMDFNFADRNVSATVERIALSSKRSCKGVLIKLNKNDVSFLDCK